MPRLSDATRIRKMIELREEIRVDQKKVDAKKAKLKELEQTSIESLLKKGLLLQKTESGTISVSEEEVAQVDDWDAVFKYIRKKDAFHLMYKRILNPAWREEVAANRKKPVPGIKGFTKYKLALRKT